jgi:hypothetical protein
MLVTILLIIIILIQICHYRQVFFQIAVNDYLCIHWAEKRKTFYGVDTVHHSKQLFKIRKNDDSDSN